MKKVNFVQFNTDEEQENIIYMLGSKDAMNIDFKADITINNEELLHDYDMEDVIYALESWQHLYQFTHSTPGVEEIIFNNNCGDLDGQIFKLNDENIKKLRKII